jgi:hypothetical protein
MVLEYLNTLFHRTPGKTDEHHEKRSQASSPSPGRYLKRVSAKYGPERHVLGCIYLCHTLQSVACELLRFKSDPQIYHNLSINQSCCLFCDN